MLTQITYYVECKCFLCLGNSKLKSVQLHPVCVWCGLFYTICSADAPVALFCPQNVCDVVCSPPYVLLMHLWPCSALSLCVIWFVLHHMCCWCSCGLVLLLVCVWCGLFSTICAADAPVALFCPQYVCDVVCSPRYVLLMPLWPCSALSLCVMWSVLYHMCCWCFCGLVLPSACVWCGLFSTIWAADAPVALFCPQYVGDVVCSPPYVLLMLLWPCSALRLWVMWSFLHHMCCWCSIDWFPSLQLDCKFLLFCFIYY